MRDLVCDVINCCVGSIDMGKMSGLLSAYHNIVIEKLKSYLMEIKEILQELIHLKDCLGV